MLGRCFPVVKEGFEDGACAGPVRGADALGEFSFEFVHPLPDDAEAGAASVAVADDHAASVVGIRVTADHVELARKEQGGREWCISLIATALDRALCDLPNAVWIS